MVRHILSPLLLFAIIGELHIQNKQNYTGEKSLKYFCSEKKQVFIGYNAIHKTKCNLRNFNQIYSFGFPVNYSNKVFTVLHTNG